MTVPREPSSAQPLRLGALTPRYRPVEVERVILKDGEPLLDAKGEPVTKIVQLDAYVSGPRCPGSVKADMAGARNVFNDALAEAIAQAKEDDPALRELDDKAVIDLLEDRYVEAATRELYRIYARSLIADLTLEEADVLSGDTDTMIELLRGLGWYSAPPVEGQPATNGADPLATTSGESSQTSVVPITQPQAAAAGSTRRKR